MTVSSPASPFGVILMWQVRLEGTLRQMKTMAMCQVQPWVYSCPCSSLLGSCPPTTHHTATHTGVAATSCCPTHAHPTPTPPATTAAAPPAMKWTSCHLFLHTGYHLILHYSIKLWVLTKFATDSQFLYFYQLKVKVNIYLHHPKMVADISNTIISLSILGKWDSNSQLYNKYNEHRSPVQWATYPIIHHSPTFF